MKLSILICGLEGREDLRSNLIATLASQYIGDDVEIIVEQDDGTMTTGAKRNLLLDKAKGEYVAFVDDDDVVSSDYVLKLLTAIENCPDCCSLLGVITEDGENPLTFEHSIEYSEWKTVSNSYVTYERPPNHLNCIKSSIAKQFRFPEKDFGEDKDWSMAIQKSGLIRTEAYVPGVLYHYNFKSKK